MPKAVLTAVCHQAQSTSLLMVLCPGIWQRCSCKQNSAESGERFLLAPHLQDPPAPSSHPNSMGDYVRAAHLCCLSIQGRQRVAAQGQASC